MLKKIIHELNKMFKNNKNLKRNILKLLQEILKYVNIYNVVIKTVKKRSMFLSFL